MDKRVEIEVIMERFPEDHHWNYDKLCKHFPSDSNIPVEILYNQVAVQPSPNELHQELTFEICSDMKAYARQHKLGKVIISPFDVVWEGGDHVVVPDVMFVSISRKHILDGKRATDSPDLIVEVWSPGNAPAKREEKRKLYEEKGVLEFWEVYPREEKITIKTFDEKSQTHQLFSGATLKGSVQSRVLDGFSLDVEELFERVKEE